ncbi:DUF222 domain-containing protein [Agromyces sp. CFH 90414]|uniref:DUF222 domain-containing protein n=1 Tax=Agromyces agglutinans TaxID=2662258 RepID=A0A6I2FAN7_9MICO|nr:HNH endonuclease signature motif containing protein [Agromyces agglutinans]MRG60877.1 DUF222 domain-containing protein [Agromyces agglutinans]
MPSSLALAPPPAGMTPSPEAAREVAPSMPRRAERSSLGPLAQAREGLSALVDASIEAQRLESMHAAMQVDLIYLTVSHAVRCADAFVAASASPGRRHELIRRSVVAELSAALRVAERTMQRRIDDAWSLTTELPATLAALRAGHLTLQHARVVIDHTLDLHDDPRLRAELDERLASFAETTTPARLRVKARRLREQLTSESIAERHSAARDGRRVELEPAADGMAWLHCLLPAADALRITARLDAAAHASAADQHGDAPRRGADQTRADLARDLLLYGRLPEGADLAEALAAARASVHVTVPVLTLLGDPAPGDLDGYGPIDADTARRLAADAPSFVRLLTHPVTGTVLDVDRTRYRPPADLKRWLQVRDGTCRFPTCARPAARSDLDHTEDWADGNRTSHDNLAHCCPAHHHLKHETAWSVRQSGAGVLRWRSPAGREHVTHPAQQVPAGRRLTPYPDPPPF